MIVSDLGIQKKAIPELINLKKIYPEFDINQ